MTVPTTPAPTEAMAVEQVDHFPKYPPVGSYRHDRDFAPPDAATLKIALLNLSREARRAVAEWQNDQPYNPVCYHAYAPGFAHRCRIYGQLQYRLTPLGLAIQREIAEGRA